MKKRSLAATVVAMGLVLIPGVHAKTLEDVLKEKGVITEEDYKEVTRSKALNYKPGKGFTLTSADEKFQLSLGGRLQTRYTFTDADDNGTSRDSNKFEVKRMKFWLNGYAYTKDLTYLLQVDFVQGGSSKLLDHAYLNYRFVDEAQVLAGQTKVPFGRQWLNSSGSQQFVDRSTASDMFRPGYEAGVKVHGAVAGGIATYELGYYGGAGQSTFRTSNDNAYAARITANPFGKMAYAEGDLDQSEKPLLSVGANYYRNTLQKSTATAFETNNVTLAGSTGWLGKGIGTFANGEKIDINGYGVDAAFKWLGASTQAEYLLGQADGHTSDKTLRAHGFYAQAGYCIIPRKLELAFRYSFVDPNRDKANDQQVDTQGAISYYFNKHNLKLQGDVTNSHDQSKGRTDDMIYRLQAQVIF
ncbi:phosphate-selective outer membrane channel [Geotalea daltonii FRC-32]|uniref:Phosphate-selective outer membrane channel n=1 Tax=Geotalea daltonii (strain DSM 22248 / JCM 15807 / FRC-32) TaxID=316067 RepID=B9M986_GEODF|nr:porin [Geotalea daltonii]ACM18644.1 phosphate-selective outer membrane channel [Geotalea daltonii FRC-32]